MIGYPSFYQRTYPGQYQNAPFIKGKSWIQAHNELGWVFNTEGIIHSKKYKQVSYEANDQGFRDDKEFNLAAKNNDEMRVMVLGDSFVFGSYINQKDTIPSMLENKLVNKPEVFNLGIPGWGIDQMYLAYKYFNDRINPDITMLFYIDRDILRVFEAYRHHEKMNKPSFEFVNGKLSLRNETARPLWKKLAEKSLVWGNINRLYGLIQSKRITEALFQELAKLCEANGQKLVVVRIPIVEELACHNWNMLYLALQRTLDLEKFFAKTGVVYINLIDSMRHLSKDEYESLYIPNDGHLNEKGSAVVVDLVYNALSE